MHKKEILGVVYGVLAAFFYSCMGTFMKLAKDVPVATIILIANLIAAILIYFTFFFHKKKSLKTNKWPTYILRTLFGASSYYCFVFAAKKIPLVNAMLLFNTAPLFVPIIVLIWMKYRIGVFRMVAIITGFLGVMLILKPTSLFSEVAELIGLFSGMFVAMAYVAVRILSKTERPEKIIFYFCSGCVLLSILPCILTWKSGISLMSWGFLIAIGCFTFCFQSCITRAYTYAVPTKVSALGYFAVIFSGVIEWIIWGRVPDVLTFIGVTVVIASGVFVLIDKKVAVPIGKKHIK
jgi:drug/metabolite transporter (DMT)-like permease